MTTGRRATASRRSTRGGGRPGRAIRRRGPRWWSGWLRDRALRRGGRSRRRAGRGGPGRWHLPAPGLHPGQGAPADGRGAAHDPAGARLRRRRGRARRSTWPGRRRASSEVIDRLTKGLETLLKGRKVTVFDQRGEVVDAAAHQVRLADGTEVEGANLVIATGSYAARRCPGLDFDGTRVLSSDHVLELDGAPGPRRHHRRWCDRRASSRRCSSTWAARSRSSRRCRASSRRPTSTPATSSPARSRSAASACTPVVARHRHRGRDRAHRHLGERLG